MRALMIGASDRRLGPRSVAETGHGLPWFHGKQDLSRSTFSNDRRSAPHQRVRAHRQNLYLLPRRRLERLAGEAPSAMPRCGEGACLWTRECAAERSLQSITRLHVKR